MVENAYNGDGRRVIKTVNGASTYYLYEYDKVILETNVFGDTTGRNVYGLNLLIRTVGVDTFYYMYNGHADVTALLTPSGQVAATYYYDAFGNVLEQTGNVDNSILFAGYQYDKETGLYYLNARMYDPITARFMQEDTYLGQQNDPLSLNLYTYCHNSPLMYWDPTGHSAEYRQGGFQFGMNSTADNMAQREARRAMNRTHTGRHINNVAEAAQVSAGHGGDTFKAPTMAYHSPAIVDPLNTGYSHTLDDYAYQQTVSSQLHARQVAESTLISNPFAAEDDFYNYIRNDYYYEVAREETINNLIACNKSELTLYGIEKATLQNQVSDYEALYYETQGFYAKQQRLYSCMSQSIVGIGQSIKGAGDALGDSWYADFSNLKSTVDWVSGDISFSEYCQIVENNEKTKRSIEVGFYNGFFEKVVNGNPVVQTQNLIGTVQYICTGDTSVLDVTGNFNKQKDEFLIETFNLNEEHFYNGESAANTTWMVGELLLSLYCIRASSSTPSLSDTPIADPYRMSYSGNAQVQMQGFTSTAQREAFYQLRAARAQARATIEGGSEALNPKDIHFMQSSIKNQTGSHTVLENIDALKNGTLKPEDLPTIKVWQDEAGKIWTLDHRRLASFKGAELDGVPVQWATPQEVADQMWKMTTQNGGTSIKLKLGNGQSTIIK